MLDGCQMLLLAKDGVYLPIAPRSVVQGLLASGNRADLLINCPEGHFDFKSTKVNDNPQEPSSGSGEPSSGSGEPSSGSGEPSSGSGEPSSGSGEPSSGPSVEEPNDEKPNPTATVIKETLLFIRADVSPGNNRTCDLPVFEVNRPCCDRPPFEPGTQRSAHRTSADPVFASCFRQTSSTCASKR